MSREVSPIPPQLRKLMRKADATATKADEVIRGAIHDLRGALAVIATDEPIATSAKARESAFAMIRKRMARLGERLDEIIRASIDYAGEMAASAASDETGLTVRYSKKRADEMVALVSPNQGENLAAVFTDKMGKHVIDALRNATVASLRENAVAGGSMKSLARDIGRRWQSAAKQHETFTFVDSSGRTWDTKTYLAMNVRTNAMRVYNDLLVDDIAQAVGSDLVRVSRGGDPNCHGCGAWEGVILSVSGKTKGFPTYDQAKAAGCFHPNCTHTLEYVDETADADEIARQRKHPFNEKDGLDEDVARKRQHKIEEEAYKDDGMSASEAKIAVDRDRLVDAVRNGLLTEDADEIVKKLTDAQVKALCKAGMPPEFTPTKGTKKNPEEEKWRHGARGGIVHVRRDATSKDIVRVCGLGEEDDV